MDLQPSLFDLPLAPRRPMPDGFRYQPDLITPEEERALVRQFAGLDFKPYEHLGYLGNRRIAAFGWRRGDDGAMVETGEGVPDFLTPLLTKVAAFTGLSVESFRHALVTEYAPGAGIGWHRDRPPAVAIAGVSLLSPCTFRLRRKVADIWDRASIIAAPRSAYLMSGPARSDWQHSIPEVDVLRYSVTFRTVRT
ncbi:MULTISPECIES: alpha-ketoglutarate-dependent dioxygenase AlkB [unclassified Caulobacter]|uniref:alpha-ketoglutarate-dependent dioxygenase AlkB n=1 Tax=unclassified Caulobacter TaxID=2648921 RepID=UPI001015D462|nr:MULTISPECIES: alpha-ketoglutarate-dependent dioxygenase AlkB [unclassified Caulobacter]MBQ1562847.1 alpha-ketoglutarate-dependent dioxygenase AlkB [Caulobacter sp.]